MVQGVIVDAPPVAPHEGGNEQQQGALRLMEVGYDGLHDAVAIARGNEDLRGAMERLDAVAV